MDKIKSLLPAPEFVAATGKRKRSDDTPLVPSPDQTKWNNLPATVAVIDQRSAEIHNATETFLNQQHRVLRRPCAEGVINGETRCVELHCANNFGLLQYMGRREKDCVYLTYEEALFACDCGKLAVFMNAGRDDIILLSLEDCWSVLLDTAETDNRYAVYSWLWRSGYVPLHASQHRDTDSFHLNENSVASSFDFACYMKNRSFKKTSPGPPVFYVRVLQNDLNSIAGNDLMNLKPVTIQTMVKNAAVNTQTPVVLAAVVNGKVVLHSAVSIAK